MVIEILTNNTTLQNTEKHKRDKYPGERARERQRKRHSKREKKRQREQATKTYRENKKEKVTNTQEKRQHRPTKLHQGTCGNDMRTFT